MGSLRHIESGRRVVLGARCLVGRAASCDLRVGSRRVSGEHARIQWSDGSWWVRDLGSRNGTFLDSQPLRAGTDLQLGVGSVVQFGGPEEAWQLDDDGPPVALARSLDGTRERQASDGLLALPDDDHPAVLVVQDDDGRWMLESASEERVARDREVVVVGQDGWQLFLPAVVPGTLDATRGGGAELALAFQVSRDEEHVSIRAAWRGREHELKARSHNYLLLTLARRRLEEAKLPVEERGWMYRDDLLRQLRLSPEQLNLLIFRARRSFSAAGLKAAGTLIERRRDTLQLRIGVDRLSVTQP